MHSKSPGLGLMETVLEPSPELMGRVEEQGVSSEQLLGAAILAPAAKSRRGGLQEGRCLWSIASGHFTDPAYCMLCHRSAVTLCCGSRVQPLRSHLGVAEFAVRAARPYSHHFNKEMIKRRWGGWCRKTQNICFTSNRVRFLCSQGMCKSRRAGRCT